MIETEQFRVYVRINNDLREEDFLAVDTGIINGVVEFIHEDGESIAYVLANILGWRIEDVDR